VIYLFLYIFIIVIVQIVHAILVTYISKLLACWQEVKLGVGLGLPVVSTLFCNSRPALIDLACGCNLFNNSRI
jgi:hypothetical protein